MKKNGKVHDMDRGRNYERPDTPNNNERRSPPPVYSVSELAARAEYPEKVGSHYEKVAFPEKVEFPEKATFPEKV